MPDEQHFRPTVFERMRAALGEPEVSKVRDGEVYRWTLRRRMDLNSYVTLDSPEHHNLAHIMLSDGSRYQSKPILSVVIFTLEEADKLIRRIVMQWRGEGGQAIKDACQSRRPMRASGPPPSLIDYRPHPRKSVLHKSLCLSILRAARCPIETKLEEGSSGREREFMITNTLRGVLCIGGAVAALLPAARARADIISTFDASDEGWTPYNGATSQWIGTIGNPPGSLVGVEAQSGIIWYFSAPGAFLGDQSSHYNGSLSWEVIALDTGSPVTSTVADVVLKGPAGAVGFAIPDNGPVLSSWTLNTVTLNEAGWYIINFPSSQIPSNTPATAELFQEILSNLTGVYIQGEYFNGPDSSALDNVRMIAVSCPADFDGSGFVDTDDYDAFIHAFEDGTDDADFDQSGFVDTDDFTSFVLAFEAGC